MLPALKQASDSPENADCLYHIAKLLLLDLERAELIGSTEDRIGVFNMQYAPMQTEPAIVGPAAIAMHFLTGYLHRRPSGPHAVEALLIKGGVPFSGTLSDLDAFRHKSLAIKPVAIAYCEHSDHVDFSGIESFFAQFVDEASRDVRGCLFLKELGGILSNSSARMSYQSFRNEKSLQSRNLEQVRFGVLPFRFEMENEFTQALLRFLVSWHLPVTNEDLSFESWSLHEQVDRLEEALSQSVTKGNRAQVIEAYTGAKVAKVAAIRTRDVEFADQIRRELDTRPDTLLLTARGSNHQFTLSRQLQTLKIQYSQFHPEGYGPTQESRFIEAIQNCGEIDSFRPTAEQELLILRAIIANTLRNTMDRVVIVPSYRGPRVSGSYKSTMASKIVDRWDDLAVERYFAAPHEQRGAFARHWLVDNATADERALLTLGAAFG
jgi:hypothetical protein